MEEGVITHGAVMLDVDNDALRCMIPSLNDPVQQELKALKSLVTTTDQTLRFFGSHLKNQMTVTFLLFDLCNKTKMTKDPLKDIAGSLIHRSWGGRG